MAEFLNRHQVPLRIRLAKPARHGAVLGKRPVQLETHHGEEAGVGGCRLHQKPGEHAKRVRPIEVIRVDDREWPVQQGGGAEHGMAGAPRLLALGRHAVSWRHHLELLESVIRVDVPGKAPAETVPEVLLDLPADDEDKLAKTGPLGVEDGIVQYGLAGGADGLNLFQTAVTGADAGGQDD